MKDVIKTNVQFMVSHGSGSHRIEIVDADSHCTIVEFTADHEMFVNGITAFRTGQTAEATVYTKHLGRRKLKPKSVDLKLPPKLSNDECDAIARAAAETLEKENPGTYWKSRNDGSSLRNDHNRVGEDTYRFVFFGWEDK